MIALPPSLAPGRSPRARGRAQIRLKHEWLTIYDQR
jgi:hypothetical protein